MCFLLVFVGRTRAQMRSVSRKTRGKTHHTCIFALAVGFGLCVGALGKRYELGPVCHFQDHFLE